MRVQRRMERARSSGSRGWDAQLSASAAGERDGGGRVGRAAHVRVQIHQASEVVHAGHGALDRRPSWRRRWPRGRRPGGSLRRRVGGRRHGGRLGRRVGGRRVGWCLRRRHGGRHVTVDAGHCRVALVVGARVDDAGNVGIVARMARARAASVINTHARPRGFARAPVGMVVM